MDETPVFNHMFVNVEAGFSIKPSPYIIFTHDLL